MPTRGPKPFTNEPALAEPVTRTPSVSWPIWCCWTDHTPYDPTRRQALAALVERENQQHTDTPETAPLAC